MTTLIGFLQKVTESQHITIISKEIGYLLHIRKIGKDYDRTTESLQGMLTELMNNYSAYTMNYRVLAVLIETNYIQLEMNLGGNKS